MKKVFLLMCLCFMLIGCGTDMSECRLLAVDMEKRLVLLESECTNRSFYHIGEQFGDLRIIDIQEDKVTFSNGWSISKLK